MNGVAFEAARRRVTVAIDASTERLIEGTHENIAEGQTDLMIAMHTGIPREALADWALGLGWRGMQAVAAEDVEVLPHMAGLLLQGFLTGFFAAEEVAARKRELDAEEGSE